MTLRKNLLTFLVTCCFLFSLSIPAQENDKISIEFGNVFKNDEREIPTDILGSDDTGYYLLYAGGRFGRGKKSVRKFSLELLPTGEEILLGGDKNATQRSLGVAKVNDKIIHIWSSMDDSGKKYFFQTIDLKTFSSGPTKFIAEIKNDTRKASRSMSRFMISDDEKTIALFYTVPNKNKELQKIRVQKFDTDFNVLETGEFEFNYQNKVLAIQDVLLDRDNNFVIVTKKYNSTKIVKEELNHKYEFQFYRIKNDELKLVHTIIPNDVHLRSLKPIIDKNNNLFVSGIISKVNLYAMTGVYAAKINLDNGTEIFETYSHFDANYITLLLEDGKRKERILKRIAKGKHEDPNYILRHVMLNENGEQTMIAEQIHSYTYNYATTFYHQNLALIKLNDKGDVIWSTKIGKNQTKPNVAIYSSYYPVTKDDDLILLYNCHESNLSHTKGTTANPFLGAGKIFIATSITMNTGAYTRQKLANKEQLDGITIRPSLYNWIDDSTLLMFGQDIDNLKNQGFVKLKFE